MGCGQPLRVVMCLPIAHNLGRGILLGFNAVAERNGWKIIIATHGNVEYVRSLQPDVLVVTPNTWAPLMEQPWGKTIVIGIQQQFRGRRRACIGIDDRAVGEIAADHLLAQGLTQFATFNFDLFDWSIGRSEGFRRRIVDAGYPVEQFQMFPQPYDRTFREDALLEWLEALPKPVGILASCDSWAQALIEYCDIARLRVPEDVAIVGVDNDELLCELTRPRLSSVAIPWQQVGRAAEEVVRRLLDGQPQPRVPVLVPPSGMAVRHSSTVQAVPDGDVAAALAIIREHAHRPLSVADILRQIPAHRHKLERGFRTYLKRTMTAEIRRVHVEQAKRLLASTSLSIAEVASRSGFPNARKLAVAFRQETGATPSNYRSRFRVREVFDEQHWVAGQIA